MLHFFDKCPGCGGPLVITECHCNECGLTMRAEFKPPQFATLSQDQLTFIRIFLRARGNLSEVEKLLGVSYPSIRNKLDEINKTLDAEEAESERKRAEPDPDPAEQERRAVLQQVEAGEISAVEAVQKLRNLGGDV